MLYYNIIWNKLTSDI